MSGRDVVRAWTGAGFEPADPAEHGAADLILAADSWLVVDGAVLALDRHRERFARAAAEVGGDPAAARAAVDAAMQHVPAGNWSPRLDLTPEGIRLRIRPAPAARGTVEVVTASRDPRTLPLRKGPDLAALALLQAEERERAGAEVEPILTTGADAGGLVAEGAWSALLWWHGDELRVPAAGVPRLPSVTAAVLLELAEADGVVVREVHARPDDLAGDEVWLANALRGIRVVTRWHGGPEVGRGERATAWQERLAALRQAPAIDAPIASRR
ncbi:aminotransferase class IV [Agrococcus jenensis]|uniref:aminotransferase class IV n=1 Tax=Agrococcus jenensis TaxID=46353 RepID=UPI000F4B7FA1|nr:aminotransferase class IV [Agrococcus jenensis]